MINWKVRIKNKSFWIAMIPAVLLLVQVIAAVFGYTLDLVSWETSCWLLSMPCSQPLRFSVS
ncbi:phi LC3 family holin [Moryella indoligenes]|uniref:Phi LC3 family holin n=1 Tax=Moryella indoligenes TaxID=371674 RepID=A0AAE3VAL8_9FIRM|nr:phi LC3 family holin [Moryella indoligenes]